MPRTSEPGRSVGSRLLQLLFAFQSGRRSLSLAELVRQTGIPHATVHRLLGELVAAGALERTADGRYTIGVRLWQLGTLAPRTESLRATALPAMTDLYSVLRQHVQLAVLDGEEAVIVERRSVQLAAARATVLASAFGISRRLGWRPGVRVRTG